MTEVWAAGDAYERFMGRWSSLIAVRFVAWLAAGPGLSWLDVGCGTGALTGAVLRTADPAAVTGVDSAAGFVRTARDRTGAGTARFAVADAAHLPFPGPRFDLVASGLMLNFTPDPAAVVAELARVTRPGGRVGGYVWDYAAGMAMLRHFWDAAVAVDSGAARWDEGSRFPLCAPPALAAAWTGAGLTAVRTGALTVSLEFADFDDLWEPFLGGQGPAPGYLVSLPAPQRDRIAAELRRRLPPGPGGAITVPARAWAVCGDRPAAAG